MELKIFDYGMNGEGVAKQDGKVCLVENAMLGEKIEAEIVEDNKNFSVCKLNKILLKSEQRVNPPCPYFGVCGGCDLQHMSKEEQLNFKKYLIEKEIKKIANIEVKVENIFSKNDYFYRNKASFMIKNNNIGFFKKNSHEIVDINKCLISKLEINNILEKFKKFIKNSNEKNKIKNLVVRNIKNNTLIGVVSNSPCNLDNFSKELNLKNCGLFNIINKRNDSVVLSGKVIHVAGIDSFENETFGVKYPIDIMSFHQTNDEIQEVLYERVLDLINPNSKVLNGFSGQGLLSAVLAKKAESVVGIEIEKSSHLSAEKLKNFNKITNLTNVLGDFNVKFKKNLKNIDTLILDPSKKGCGKNIMCGIIGVENLIYISCNPIALAKDLREILDFYEIEKIEAFDMFPNTKNVETLVKLKIK